VTARPAYRLTLRAPPDGVPDGVKLRRLLKALLRRFGLRCLSVEEVPAVAPAPAKGCVGDAGQAGGSIDFGATLSDRGVGG
jgi:hypothetical protein